MRSPSQARPPIDREKGLVAWIHRSRAKQYFRDENKKRKKIFVAMNSLRGEADRLLALRNDLLHRAIRNQ